MKKKSLKKRNTGKKSLKKSLKKRISRKTRNKYRSKQKRSLRSDGGILKKIADFFRCSPKKKSNVVYVRPPANFSEKPEESFNKDNDLVTSFSHISSEPVSHSSHNAEYSLNSLN